MATPVVVMSERVGRRTRRYLLLAFLAGTALPCSMPNEVARLSVCIFAACAEDVAVVDPPVPGSLRPGLSPIWKYPISTM